MIGLVRLYVFCAYLWTIWRGLNFGFLRNQCSVCSYGPDDDFCAKCGEPW